MEPQTDRFLSHDGVEKYLCVRGALWGPISASMRLIKRNALIMLAYLKSTSRERTALTP